MRKTTKIKNNRGPAPYEAKGFRSGFPGSETWRSAKHVLVKAKTSPSSTTGFVILFAVTISAILLSIALGVADIALREIKFGTLVKDSNDAFFAADAGLECALINDKSTSTIFVSSPVGSMQCLSGNVAVNGSSPSWSFTIFGLSGGNGCAKVTVDKTNPITNIISKGYNNGGGTCTPGPNTVERQIELSY